MDNIGLMKKYINFFSCSRYTKSLKILRKVDKSNIFIDKRKKDVNK